MIDLAWDQSTDDLAAGADLQLATDGAELLQRVRTTWQTHLGEAVFDVEAGIPWIGEVLTRSPRLQSIEARFRAVTMAVSGVTGIDSMDLELDAVTRRLTAQAVVRSVYGDLAISG